MSFKSPNGWVVDEQGTLARLDAYAVTNNLTTDAQWDAHIMSRTDAQLATLMRGFLRNFVRKLSPPSVP